MSGLIKRKNSILNIPIRNLVFIFFSFSFEALLLFGNNNFYFDEILLILSIFIIIAGLIKNFNFYYRYVILFFLLFLIGLISYYISGFQRSLYLLIADYLLVFKFLFYFFGIYIFFRHYGKKIDLSTFHRANKYFMSFLIVVATILILKEKFIDGVDRPVLFSDYSGYTGAFLIYSLISFLIYYEFLKIIKINVASTIILIFIIVDLMLLNHSTTLLIAFLIFLFFILNRLNISKVIIYLMLIVAGIICIVLFSEKITEYFGDSNHPRYLLYYNSLAIFIRCFPFGCGLSLYGTSIASDPYSPLYIELGFNDRRGMRDGETMFLTDAYYPGIIAEFGFLGLVVLFFLIYKIIKLITAKKTSKFNLYVFFVFLALALYGVTFNILNTLSSFAYFFIVLSVFGQEKNRKIIIANHGINSFANYNLKRRTK